MSKTLRILPVNLSPISKYGNEHRYLLWFGCVGTTHVLVQAFSLDDALEEAATALKAMGYEGYFTEPEYSQEFLAYMRSPRPFGEETPRRIQDLQEEAEADLTYTESGWLVSYEWGISAEDPTKEQLIEMFKEAV